jgi:hypothetical protein
VADDGGAVADGGRAAGEDGGQSYALGNCRYEQIFSVQFPFVKMSNVNGPRQVFRAGGNIRQFGR